MEDRLPFFTAAFAWMLSMEEDPPSWFYSAPLATLLLCGAVAIFLLGYLPEAEKARECEARVAAAQQRIHELSRQEAMARRRIAELQAGVPEAVEEAIREVMKYGKASDFLANETRMFQDAPSLRFPGNP